MKNVTVAGGGVLGSQIAFQAAYSGCDVTIWLRSEGSIGRTMPKLAALESAYLKSIETMDTTPTFIARGIVGEAPFDKADCIERAESASSRISLETDLARAVEKADVVIESVAESIEAKTAFYHALAPVLPKKPLLLTNSSTLLPSQFANETGCPDRYLALHFANQIWVNNMAEVMRHSGTSQESFEQAMAFARQIRMIPIAVLKEKSGYLLNSILVPFLFAALDLLAAGVGSIEDVDMAWTLATGAPLGPCRIMDQVGMITVQNIVGMYLNIPENIAPFHYKAIYNMVQKYIDAGKLGVSSGEGFYKY